jgi:hypothetical protein
MTPGYAKALLVTADGCSKLQEIFHDNAPERITIPLRPQSHSFYAADHDPVELPPTVPTRQYRLRERIYLHSARLHLFIYEEVV